MLKYLTLTGIDEHCCISELVELQRKYPQIEFGVLMSLNNTGVAGHNRYPSLEKIWEFAEAGLNLSGHFCGRLAGKCMQTGDLSEVDEFLGDLKPVFQRMQFNINGHICSSVFRYTGGTPIIIQAGTKESRLFYSCMSVINKSDKVQGLIDKSGGRGKFDGYFEVVDNPNEFVGYAGGLGVDNVSRVLIDLKKQLGERDFWIDMESSLRDEDDWFDIDKARRVCELVF